MNNPLFTRLAGEITRQVDGSNWYSSNFKGVIENITADDAVKKFHGFPNSIAEIVRHMTQWKIFCLKKMEGDSQFDIKDNSEDDWKRYGNLSEEEWESICNEFGQASNALGKKVSETDDAKLDEIVPGRKYSFFTMIMGLIEHEVWHLMQIKFIKRLALVPEE